MTFQHKDLAAGRWFELSLAEQLGNVGSDVARALTWQQRGNVEHCTRAVDRAFELLDLTLADTKHRGRLREIVRIREVLADYFYGDNRFGSSPDLWRGYLDAFAIAARARR
jgi:hypothetical protein